MRIYIGTDKRPAWHYFRAISVSAMLAEHSAYLRRKQVTLMSDVFARYAAEEIPKKAGATETSDNAALKSLLPFFGKLTPQAVTPSHVVAYIDARGKQAPIRANREAALLSHIFTKCRHWGLLEENPAQKLHYRNPEPPRTRYVTDAELRAALFLAPPTIRYVIWLCRLTGLRRADMLALTWGNVQPDALVVELAKSRRRGAVPKRLAFEWSASLSRLFVRAGLLLDKKNTRDPDARVFGRLSESAFARRWTKLQDELESRGIPRFQLKDVRAKYGTDLEARGGDPTRNLAHSSRSITQRHYQRRPVKIEVQ